MQPNLRIKLPRPNAPPRGYWDIRADYKEADGPQYHLRGHAEVEGSDSMLSADEIDYDSDAGDVKARGNVIFHQYERDEEVHADRAEYNVDDETGKFFNVRGWSRTRIDARPGVLTSNNPLYFQGEWAERLQEKYILHHGMVTNCKLPNPWWTLRGPTFDIVPDDRAIAHKTVFRLKGFPLFYTPYFYKSLEKVPRKSGLLTPNIGNSSRRGKMIGLGYYWAVNRSYDVTYRVQDFTERGLAHHIDFRGKPHAGSDFDAIFYGVQDRGLKVGDTRIKQGGFSVYGTGGSDLGDGFTARGTLNYLSSLQFRQAFTESFNEAIFSENYSVGFITKHWSSFSFNSVFARLENFESTAPHDSIVIRKLPDLEFSSRERQVWSRGLPIWVSFESSIGLLRRTQPLFQTRQFSERADLAPRVMTAFSWKGFHIVPAFSVRETHYGEIQKDLHILGTNFNRNSREVTVEMIAPSFERVFNRKTWLGDKLKHVVEPRASYRYVSGVEDFDRIIRFDELDLISNTNEIEISLTNRLYTKRGNDVSEVFSWQVSQRRYFDPTFGGAIVPGQRNVVMSSVDLTPYAFLDQARNYSPVISVFRASPKPGFGFEWRADYDPLRDKLMNSGFTGDIRRGQFFISAGHTLVHDVTYAGNTSTILSPNANQFRGRIGYGDQNHRGWNAGFDAIYDYRSGVMQFATTQVTYNTDCCGLSIQYRRFSFGVRNENQFRVAFAVANIGSFGTLKKQERLF